MANYTPLTHETIIGTFTEERRISSIDLLSNLLARFRGAKNLRIRFIVGDCPQTFSRSDSWELLRYWSNCHLSPVRLTVHHMVADNVKRPITIVTIDQATRAEYRQWGEPNI